MNIDYFPTQQNRQNFAMEKKHAFCEAVPGLISLHKRHNSVVLTDYPRRRSLQ